MSMIRSTEVPTLVPTLVRTNVGTNSTRYPLNFGLNCRPQLRPPSRSPSPPHRDSSRLYPFIYCPAPRSFASLCAALPSPRLPPLSPNPLLPTLVPTLVYTTQKLLHFRGLTRDVGKQTGFLETAACIAQSREASSSREADARRAIF